MVLNLNRKGQSSIIALVILVGVAIALGIGFLSYFNSLSRESTRMMQRDSLLAYELTSQLVRTIAVDDSRGDVWLLIRRLDNSNGTFFVATEVFDETGASSFLQCSNVRVYMENMENGDNLLCYKGDGSLDENECPGARLYSTLSPEKILLRPQGTASWINLNYYKAQRNELLPQREVPICRLDYRAGENEIVLVSLGESAFKVRLYIGVPFQDSLYIIKTYDVSLR